MLRKILSAALSAVMLFSCFACANREASAGNESEPRESAATSAANGTEETGIAVPDENFVLHDSDRVFDGEIEDISVQSLPSRTDYYAGDRVELDGLVLKITYKNGKKGTKRSDFSYAPLVLTEPGAQQIEVTYRGHAIKIDITVKEGAREYLMATVGSDIIKKIAENTGGAHPRFIFTPEKIERLKNMRSESEAGKKIQTKIIAAANSELNKDLGRFYLSDGLRQGDCWNIYSRILALGTAYYMTGKDKYAERAVKELVNVAEWGDWNAFKHYLDVGCTVGFMGLGYDWFYNEMTGEQREKIRKAIVELAFDPAIKYDFTNSPFKKGYNWYNDTPGDNWKFICGGGLGIAAMAMCDSPDVSEKCETVLQNVYAELYRFIRNIYDEKDGSYMEGISYWSFGLTYFSVFASCMETAAGTLFDLTDWPGMAKTGNFVLMISNNSYTAFSFGDGGATVMANCPELLWVGHNFSDYTVSAMRIDYLTAAGGVATVFDALWYDGREYAPLEKASADYAQEGVANATFRTGWDGDAVFAGIHYGHNDVCHGHLDMGDFVVDVGNTRFIRDLGAEDYNLPGCYSSYRVRAEGHNTIVVNPSELTDQNWSGETYISRCSTGTDRPFAIADMTSAYKRSDNGVTSETRGLMLDRPTGTVIIRDEIKCSADDLIIWSAHTSADISLSEDGRTAVLKQDGKTLYAVIRDEGTFTVEDAVSAPTSPKVDNQSKNVGVRKLVIRLQGSDSHAVTVSFSTDRDMAETVAVSPLGEW